MPSVNVRSNLHDGAGVWWSASDMLKSSKRSFSYIADAPGELQAVIHPDQAKAQLDAEIEQAMHYGGLQV